MRHKKSLTAVKKTAAIMLGLSLLATSPVILHGDENDPQIPAETASEPSGSSAEAEEIQVTEIIEDTGTEAGDTGSGEGMSGQEDAAGSCAEETAEPQEGGEAGGGSGEGAGETGSVTEDTGADAEDTAEEQASKEGSGTSHGAGKDEKETAVEEDVVEMENALLSITVKGKGEVLFIYTADGSEEQRVSVTEAVPVDPVAVSAGSEVRVETKAEEDWVFIEWKNGQNTFKIKDSSFTMPQEDLKLTAVFRNKNDGLPADGASEEAREVNKDRPEKTNEELLAEQNIEALPVPERDFRFWHVEKDIAFAADSMGIKEDIKEDSRTVGRIKKNGVMYILEEVDMDWYYVESGKVRGFIQRDEIVSEELEKELIRSYVIRAQKLAAAKMSTHSIADLFTFAETTVAPADNEANLYRKCTTQQVVIDKRYALAGDEGAVILEKPDADARVCGVMDSGALAYIISELKTGGAADDGVYISADGVAWEPLVAVSVTAGGNDDAKSEGTGAGEPAGAAAGAGADESESDPRRWYYVESGDVRGFVRRGDLVTGESTDERITQAGGEDAFARSSEEVAPEDNDATYFTFTSVKEGIPLHPVRDAIIKSAEQCIGHPYVWGGTSLLGGCDCSGFVQSLYSMYGYSIPRVAEDQSRCGRQIPIENAQPGDLIFFAENGYVYHVALYVGNDQTIEAYGTGVGIIRNNVDHINGVWATRVIDD